ncbi:TetR/AcrR family transcriptional regulator [Nonomuraea rhizosphaerae]|uniref:TetR/AcrR family transcriptional regulator n=1 Tax=Nonomuraea rhizosphaerae TaxID=2665663 RepID=UPI001C5F3A39|nr:TetR family transcriptional regulator [Nonomuraea rhizosphaerae]
MAEDRGRRPGSPRTREQILEAAVAAFTSRGYAQTTIRGVAREAGVDPALVMHFFGSKDGLFATAIKESMPVGPLTEVLDDGLDGAGERLVTRYLSLWEHPEHGPRLSAVLHAAAASPAAADLLENLVRAELLGPLGDLIGGEHGRTRALLAGSQLLGLAMFRYVLRIDPLASLPVPRVAAMVAPNVQRYLTGTLTAEELTR